MIRTLERFEVICDICEKSAGVCELTPEEAEIKAQRKGWAFIEGRSLCAKCRIPDEKRKNGKVYPILRMLEEGDYVVFPLRLWQRARSAASIIKKEFGAVFEVRRLDDDIIVTRKI